MLIGEQSAAETDVRWMILPYGKWTLEDGTEILFNRRYCPILRRSRGGKPEFTEPYWVHGIVKVEYYYNDATENNSGLDLARSVLLAWLRPVYGHGVLGPKRI